MDTTAKKVKTSELTGAALDWAVAVCKNLEIHPPQKDMKIAVRNVEWEPWWVFTPSTNWAQGGPILEREEISVTEANGQWVAFTADTKEKYEQIEYGSTPLIAAMRCYVASMMDEVELPEELA